MTKAYKCEVDCASCAAKIEEKAKKLDEIESFVVNYIMGRVKISIKSGYNEKEVLEKISKIFSKVDPDSYIDISKPVGRS